MRKCSETGTVEIRRGLTRWPSQSLVGAGDLARGDGVFLARTLRSLIFLVLGLGFADSSEAARLRRAARSAALLGKYTGTRTVGASWSSVLMVTALERGRCL